MRVGCPQSPNVGPVSTCLSHLPATDAGRLTSANLIGHQFFPGSPYFSLGAIKFHFSSHLPCSVLRFQTESSNTS